MATTKSAPKKVPGVIDLDARRAARLERTGVKEVRFGGEVWRFKPELPMSVVEALSEGNVQAAFGQMLEDPARAEEFYRAVDPTQADLQELLTAVYGLSLPN